ncbi:hypothetical protein PPERSA_00676 [Pseudocohnilembus persalinus]|uniref:fructose-bisphosphatase n=1 Tax=Pseudocohnilembus persalinus TaxID=266149 RepID=A0A0V0QSU6_PSEPJ|nr:hypothetical protein PPERSA_00676 [Pseudocohnilembus persalinus]|eukprot:KRX05375.1 hypothetical protein PPERSA_00676 [Pseudocohnilembus persalinus]
MEAENQKLIYSKNQDINLILENLLNGFVKLSDLLRNLSTDGKQLETKNKFGDTQLDTDVACDEIIFRELKKSGKVAFGLSEEQPEPQLISGDEKPYIVTFDPLDGSSIIGTNFTVGTIFGIWNNCDKKLIGHKLREQVTAGVVMYGPRTSLIYYNDIDEGVHEMNLKQGNWVISKKNLKIEKKGKIFAPGNLRASQENEGYKRCIDFWIKEAYTLRYTGGMVPDIYQIFIKGKGIFTNLSSSKNPAKLRVLYEVGPFAFLLEKAGGKAQLPDGSDLLDLQVSGYDQRSDIIVGSEEEVYTVERLLKGE